MVYLHQFETDLSIIDDDPILFSQAISYDNFDKWVKFMKEELKSIEHNGV